MSDPTYVCPVCGRKASTLPGAIATDSESQEAASKGLDAELVAPPFCEEGHLPTRMTGP